MSRVEYLSFIRCDRTKFAVGLNSVNLETGLLLGKMQGQEKYLFCNRTVLLKKKQKKKEVALVQMKKKNQQF